MTPPIGHDDEFAPVIPLRRRGASRHEPIVTGTPDEQARGIWDPDAPPTDLPTRPSVWDQPAATELLPRSAVDDTQDPTVPSGAPARHVRRFPRTRWTLAAMTLAAAALIAVFLIAPRFGPTHPHAARTRTTANARTQVGRQIHTTVTSPGDSTAKRPKALARRPTTRHTARAHAAHPATHAKQRPNTDASKARTRRRARRHGHPSHASLKNSDTTGGSPTTVSTSTATPVSPPTTVASNVASPTATLTAPRVTSTQAGSAASQCVPGELGC